MSELMISFKISSEYACMQGHILTDTLKEFHFTHFKAKTTAKLVHQHSFCSEIYIDVDIPATCWLSSWWYFSNICIWGAYAWCIPDIEVIWHSIEPQSGKSSDTVTVVVQCDGSKGDSCGEYEQQLFTLSSTPYIIVNAAILLSSKVRVSQFTLGTITVNVTICGYSWWCQKAIRILPTIGTTTLSSIDRVIPISILCWVHLTRSRGYCGVVT